MGSSVGIASAIVALALQDTLSNLVSGLLLLFAKPFKMGDWIEINGRQGRVVEQNWWSVSIGYEDWKLNVPNGVLSKASIINYGQGAVRRNISASFSYDDPPNEVLSALESLSKGIEEIEGEGFARVSIYGADSITYDLWYYVLPEKASSVFALLKAQLYYLTQRYGFTAPYPIMVQYTVDANQGIPNQIPQIVKNRQQELINYLRSLPYFSMLNENQIEKLSERARFKAYGKAELIIQEGKEDEGLYIIFKGTARAYITDNEGGRQIVEELQLNDAFGEMAIFPNEVSPITAIANGDLEVVVIPDREIIEAIESNNRFATEFLEYIEKRKKTVRLAKGIKDNPSPLISNNGRQAR